MKNVPKRIKSICEMVAITDTVAFDLCCDHGLIGNELSRIRLNLKKIISSDIVPSIIKKLSSHLQEKQVAIVADARKIKINENENDELVFIIAGIGGALAIEIYDNLENQCGDLVKRSYIFNVNNHIQELRGYLHKKGYKLESEKLIYDKGIYYQIFRVSLYGMYPITKVGSLMWSPYTELTHNYLISKIELIDKKLCYTNDNKMLDLKGEYLAILNQYHKEAAMYGPR